MESPSFDSNNPFDIDEVMRTFSVIVDTREQDTRKAQERYESFGCPYTRHTLSYCDYCGNITLPSGSELYDSSTDNPIGPAFAIERKMSIDELAGCFTRGRDRFRREFTRASDNQAKVILLIENGSWEAIHNHRYKSRMSPAALEASLISWMIRYNMIPIFCKSDSSGHLIKELLYRDMKARLERGEFG